MTSVMQRLYTAGGAWSDTAAPGAGIAYETEDGHNHWHLGQAARYSLWNFAKSAQVAPAMKVGFCLEDSQRVETHGPVDAVYSNDQVSFCEAWQPTAGSVYMGISAGWRDKYAWSLAFQWIDVSDVAPGSYWLRSEVDQNDIVQESNEVNAPAFATAGSTVPGYLATPVVEQGLEAGKAATLTLGATRVGNPGARRFRVESAPAHGTLSVAVGSWFTANEITYTPAADYEGDDSFTYSAGDSTSNFPLTPRTATIALGVEQPPEETVAISGAPAELTAATSAQLTATVANGPPDVDWSVDGVAGGNATVGTVTANGLYKAPATPPAGDKVKVRATGSTGAFDEVEITIVKAQDPDPAPSPHPGPTGLTGPTGTGGPTAPSRETKPPSNTSEPGTTPPITTPPGLAPLLSPLLLDVHGRLVFVGTTPGRGGVVETKAMAGSRRVGLCRAKTPARRSSVCRIRVPSRHRLRKVLLVVKLRIGGDAVATRRVRAAAGLR